MISRDPKWSGTYEGQVEMQDAKFAVFTDFGPDPHIVGFAKLEDAKKCHEERVNEEYEEMGVFLVQILSCKEGQYPDHD